MPIPDDCRLTLGLPVPRIAAVTQTSLTNTLNSRTIGQASLAFQVLYAFSLILSKFALLLLYLRVFTSQMKNFTLTLGLVAFIVLTTGASYAFVAIFQCSPVASAWDMGISGKCVDFAMVAKWLSVPNVIDGLVMLIMPIPVVWALAIETKQKIALTATFFHGIMYATLFPLYPHSITDSKQQRLHIQHRPPRLPLPPAPPHQHRLPNPHALHPPRALQLHYRRLPPHPPPHLYPHPPRIRLHPLPQAQLLLQSTVPYLSYSQRERKAKLGLEYDKNELEQGPLDAED